MSTDVLQNITPQTTMAEIIEAMEESGIGLHRMMGNEADGKPLFAMLWVYGTLAEHVCDMAEALGDNLHWQSIDQTDGIMAHAFVRSAAVLADLGAHDELNLAGEVQAMLRRARYEERVACARTLEWTVEKAARDLPDGFTINLSVEQGAGYAELFDERGVRVPYDAVDRRLPEQIEELIAMARQLRGDK